MPKQSLLLLSLIVSLSGCALPWVEPEKQTVAIQTFDGSQSIEGIACTLVNDRGQWQLISPGSAQVTPSEKDLVITCTQDATTIGAAKAVSRPTPGYFQYPITGIVLPVGAASAVQQVVVGSPHAYPESIRVPMNQAIIVTANQ